MWPDTTKPLLELLDGIQGRENKLISDKRIFNHNNCFEHRRSQGCGLLFYRYYNEKHSIAIRELASDDIRAFFA